jgi:hypothetical protein
MHPTLGDMGDASMSTQISLRLPEPLSRRLNQEARKRWLRRSDVVRQALEAFLDGGAAMAGDRPYGKNPDLIGSMSGGPPDLGERHRESLQVLIRDRR